MVGGIDTHESNGETSSGGCKMVDEGKFCQAVSFTQTALLKIAVHRVPELFLGSHSHDANCSGLRLVIGQDAPNHTIGENHESLPLGKEFVDGGTQIEAFRLGKGSKFQVSGFKFVLMVEEIFLDGRCHRGNFGSGGNHIHPESHFLGAAQG